MAHSFLKSEIKFNLLTVIIESENADNSMSSLKNRKCGHMKMQVISDIKGDILKSAVKKDVSKPERQTVHGCNAPKVLSGCTSPFQTSSRCSWTCITELRKSSFKNI